MLCMDNIGLPIVALTWAPEGSETQQLGRPGETRRWVQWRETYRMMGLNSWAGAGLKVAGRVAQRSTISSPDVHTKTRKLLRLNQ